MASNDLLSQDEIDALLSDVDSGDIDTEADAALSLDGTRSYDFRLDLRVLYQQLCNNHPLPQEPQYPLWMGLPADGRQTLAVSRKT